ncbi:hypothetical protein [Streptomyces sp. V3I7]|uniref:hypothetical protein n=1 Tax=Streptomyces sp. V3I7 TaxID=3042278 RepID=UPI0027873E7F|nr:hypothetical protein [Streptomyces sp. V3I7]MDQ0994812.1 hypothetical protein [Streptomyces sp. V3I7]
MPRRRPQQQPPVRYAATEHNGAHQVVDQLHGYALTRHETGAEAESAARQMASDPGAAVAAVQALDAAQTGPAADERRMLRRYGYAWSLRQDEMLSLLPEFSFHRLESLIADGHLAMVWSPAGMPFYCTPERFEQLPLRVIRDDSGEFAAADLRLLERHRPALELVPHRQRYRPCEFHGVAFVRCMLCGPRERFECQWGGCTANAVTAYCERCVRMDPRRTFLLPPPLRN